MKLLRRRLFACVLAVMLGQVASVMATSALLCRPASEAVAGAPLMCTCAQGPMSECPMHKSHSDPKSSSTGRRSGDARWCNACDDGGTAVLTTLLFAGAAIGERQQPVALSALSRHLMAFRAVPLDVRRSPVPRPPRA